MLRSIRRKFKKIMFHLEILDLYQKKELAETPTYIQIEPTVRCNLDCITCSRGKVIQTYRKMDITLEEIDKILSFLPNLKSVKLQGLGEPLFHPQIIEILKRFKDRNIRVWMISNGTLFLQEKYRNIILDYVPDIAVSFDSTNKETFNQLRKGADMERVIQGIKMLVEDRNKRKADTIIGINFVVSHKNYFELDTLGDLAIKLGLDYVMVADVENWMIPGELAYEGSRSFVAESRKYVKEIDDGVKKLRIKLLKKRIILGYKGREKRLGNCHWPFNSMFITVEGLANPCCMRMHREHSLGNLFQVTSFDDIWNGQAYRDFRKEHMTRSPASKLCANCPD